MTRQLTDAVHAWRSIAVCLALSFLWSACGQSESTADAPRSVTVYVSTDRVFSEPVLQEYQRRSGLTVNAVYDTEETKSTGLANRLLAEQSRPQADVFWSNEPVRTLVLKSRGVLAPYISPSAKGIPDVLRDPEGYWTGFSARMRVIAYNTKARPRGRGASVDIGFGRSQVERADGDRGSQIRIHILSRRGPVRCPRRRKSGRLFSPAQGQRCESGRWQLRRSRHGRSR